MLPTNSQINEECAKALGLNLEIEVSDTYNFCGDKNCLSRLSITADKVSLFSLNFCGLMNISTLSYVGFSVLKILQAESRTVAIAFLLTIGNWPKNWDIVIGGTIHSLPSRE